MSHHLTADPQDELLTEVNKKNEVIGSIPRSLAHNGHNKIYRTVFILILDQKNKILIQKRSPNKDLYPNYWDLSVGGHVSYGASYLDSAIKELKEELNITTSAEKLKLKGEVLVKLPKSNEFFHVFEYHLETEDKIKTNDEVAEIAWMSIEEIKKSMEQKTLKWYARPLQVIKALY